LEGKLHVSTSTVNLKDCHIAMHYLRKSSMHVYTAWLPLWAHFLTNNRVLARSQRNRSSTTYAKQHGYYSLLIC